MAPIRGVTGNAAEGAMSSLRGLVEVGGGPWCNDVKVGGGPWCNDQSGD